MTPDEVLDSIAPTANYPATMTLKPVADLENSFYVSGQVAMRDGKLVATGLVGSQVSL